MVVPEYYSAQLLATPSPDSRVENCLPPRGSMDRRRGFGYPWAESSLVLATAIDFIGSQAQDWLHSAGITAKRSCLLCRSPACSRSSDCARQSSCYLLN